MVRPEKYSACRVTVTYKVTDTFLQKNENTARLKEDLSVCGSRHYIKQFIMVLLTGQIPRMITRGFRPPRYLNH